MSQTALVTGASTGIGFHIARCLAERGHDIVGVGASERILTLPESLPQVNVTPVRADLTDRAQLDAVWQAFDELGVPLDVAVLNAGKSLGGAFVETDLDDELHMLDLNVTSQIVLAKQVVRQMADQKRERSCPGRQTRRGRHVRGPRPRDRRRPEHSLGRHPQQAHERTAEGATVRTRRRSRMTIV